MRIGIAAGLALAVMLTGCYQPELGPCAVTCNQGDLCPGATSCVDGFCRADGDDRSCLDAATPDSAGADAEMPDAEMATTIYNQLTAGSRHTCAITDTGTLRCWGLNTSSQLGVGGVIRTGEPQDIPGAWTGIDGGNAFTCGIRNGGELYCWGNNNSSQLGITGTVNTPMRVDAGGPADFIAVSAGTQHACAIRGTAERRIYCWGDDSAGQFGDGGINSGVTMREASGGFIDWVEVSAGARHTCARRGGGVVYCWGEGTHGETGTNDEANQDVPAQVVTPTLFSSIAAGQRFTCGVSTLGELYCWGDNSGNQLGIPGMLERHVPTQVGTLAGWSAVSAGFGGGCAVRNGVPECWGAGGDGEIGDGMWTTVSSPRTVLGVTDVLEIESGSAHSCARTEAGELYCWGNDGEGQCGRGTVATKYAPTRIGTDADWTTVVAGDDHSCGIRASRMFCWGANNRRQLGVTGIVESPVPVEVVEPTVTGGWSKVGVGTRHTCAIGHDATDRLWCWGDNGYGQIGHNMADDAYSPVRLNTTAINWDRLAVTPHGACAMTGTERWCWGEGLDGQFGNNDVGQLAVPTMVGGEAMAWTAMSMGASFGCGIVSGGGGWCWGRNGVGQLGQGGTSGPVLTPGVLPAGTWTAISAAWEGVHACGVRDGAALCWGNNGSGRLGTGNTDPIATPTQVVVNGGAPSSFTAVSAGGAHSCALGDGELFCWGDNTLAQLGDESIQSYSDNAEVIGTVNTWSRVSAGKEHSCGIANSGELYCWGNNIRGVIGDGTSGHGVPVRGAR